MFKTETLVAFILVAKHRSFTLAANAQRQTPMAMSKQVSQLEKRLGAPLFERSTRKIRLTQFGGEFLLRAQKIIEQHDSLSHWLESRQGKFTGILKLISQDVQTYDETIFPWLAEFHRLYPDIELIIDVKENIIDVDEDLHDIYWGVSDYLGIKHPNLKRRSIWQAQLGIFAAPDYLARFGTPNTPDELKKHQMISHPHQQPSNALVVNKSANSVQTEMEYVLLDAPIKTVSGHSKLAVQGIGLINALVDNHDIKTYVANQELVPVLQEYWYSSVELYLYYHQVKLEQPKVRAFIDFFLSKRKYW
ncbi:LysR family transcriptional regulator [Shewanella abyssi]|uniref:LysR family transcriptional regulator n=1 Tax=Shewanella abyssi TaxID=311789 RepID=UPI00200C97EB|nr:LysR family transcriptional regulator [Shewanella abyssi]MCL1051857.1 LysR family transcriptional regulator [Shewanella abyssi]